jgi:predicted nucleic acid-binding protein
MFNYYFDTARDGHADTVRMFEAIGRGEFEGFTSRYVIDELKKASEPKRSNMLELIEKYGVTIPDYNAEAERLADLYVENKIIPPKYLYDATHISIASYYNLDYILSFNFKHINKVKTKDMASLINLREGYRAISIFTPMEVLDDEETE